ncbi:hypothetical protein CWB96_00115 [Pseudoalteromonas citrea]|uniref:Uncharacterized protein n=1 Tax=Pseudoalteromonas citrea TaxID=43655 RepID=A0A5S3XW27_9GAMM|nr:hypothetical protein [Pseudoalteromonas citrea]TMP46270.1 hypothetical protein CWB97_02110 [Pseudoalteromonas citrea]TMP63046.1 hypothetical protein CWB96_00115 [Pseudoalteromonas citrea]
MAIVIHSNILAAAENANFGTMKALAQNSAGIAALRYVENKPALLVILDINNKVLASTVGALAWAINEEFDHDERYALTYRYRHNDAVDALNSFVLSPARMPLCPAIKFTPESVFGVDVRNSGLSHKALLITDQSELLSKSDITAWPDELWRGEQPLNIDNLETRFKTLELSTGLKSSTAVIQLTRLNITMSDTSLPLYASDIIVKLPGLLNDPEQMKQQMEIQLNRLTGVSTQLSASQMLANGW